MEGLEVMVQLILAVVAVVQETGLLFLVQVGLA
jgi:hypothetical protein